MISGLIPLVFFQASAISSDSFLQLHDKDYRCNTQIVFPFINAKIRLVHTYHSLVKYPYLLESFRDVFS